VEQEVWAYALHSPPRDRRNLRGWLSATVRNTVRSLRRTEVRRTQREAAAAKSELDPAPSEMVERAQLLRRLVEHVLALGEPQRSLVLAHWLEGRSLTEIARGRGQSIRTVKADLELALTHLRRQMDDTPGGRDAWSAVFLGWVDPRTSTGNASGAAAAFSAGALLIASKYALATVVVLAAGALAWLIWPHAATPESLATEPGQQDTRVAQTLAEPVPRTPHLEAPGRVAGEGASAPAKDSQAAHGQSSSQPAGQAPPPDCHVTVVVNCPDGHAQLGGGSTIWARTADARNQEVSEFVRDGRPPGYMHQFRVPEGRYTFGADSSTYGRAEATVDITLRTQRSVTLEFTPVQTIAAYLEITDPGEEPPGDRGRQRRSWLNMDEPARWSYLWPTGSEWNTEALGLRFRVRAGVGAVKWASSALRQVDVPTKKGCARWGVGMLNVYGAPITGVDFFLLGSQAENREVHPGANELVFTATVRSLERMTSTLLATVLSADTGKALEHTLTFIYASGIGSWSQSDFTMNPALELYYLAPGDVEISVESPGHATQWFKRTFLPGEVTDLGELRLEKERTIRGTVKGPVPRSGAAQVSAFDLEGSSGQFTATAAVDWGPSGSPEWGQTGTFELHGLSASTYLVSMWRPYRGAGIVVSTTRSMDVVRLQTTQYAQVTVCSRQSDERFITIRIQDPDGHPVETLHIGPTSDSHEADCILEYGAYNLVCNDGRSDLGTRTIQVDRPNMGVVIE
jgi:RNA polymerase sigma factor (sigma-70 family)